MLTEDGQDGRSGWVRYRIAQSQFKEIGVISENKDKLTSAHRVGSGLDSGCVAVLYKATAGSWARISKPEYHSRKWSRKCKVGPRSRGSKGL